MVSHDLRAPLRHLSAYLTLLREEVQEHVPAAASETMLAHLDAMGKSNQTLARMIEGVLEYARLGRSGIGAEPVALGDLVGAAVLQARQTAGTRDIDWRIATGWPEVKGDGPLLAKLLASLLDNAVKYTRHTPSAWIEVGWREGTDADPVASGFSHPGAQLVFWVRDNGAGFDSAHAHSLFMMFQRQHHSMDYEGSGTGLALSQRIVSLHRGTIRVESQPGQGCMVSITLPLTPAFAQPD
jgi:signal transduction histidine kinase